MANFEFNSGEDVARFCCLLLNGNGDGTVGLIP